MPDYRVERLAVSNYDGMRVFASFACLASLGLAFAQQPSDGPKFEVASIKSSDPDPQNTMFIGMSADGAMVNYTNITLLDCIRGAYRVRDFQIVGPDWMTKARFAISAKLPDGSTPDQIPEMLQALLADRFKLEIRREMKEQNVYVLAVGNGGAKLKQSDAKPDDNDDKALGPDGKPRASMMVGVRPGGIFITAPSASLASLAGLMSRFTARPVVDATGLAGDYDFNLSFAPEINNSSLILESVPDGAIDSTPSVFDAVKQYGLRLDARKAPLEMIIVTRLEKTPIEN
jgi:uncharacterized protein (TIGR03435 family)